MFQLTSIIIILNTVIKFQGYYSTCSKCSTLYCMHVAKRYAVEYCPCMCSSLFLISTVTAHMASTNALLLVYHHDTPLAPCNPTETKSTERPSRPSYLSTSFYPSSFRSYVTVLLKCGGTLSCCSHIHFCVVKGTSSKYTINSYYGEFL
jgi:hypothetical protein